MSSLAKFNEDLYEVMESRYERCDWNYDRSYIDYLHIPSSKAAIRAMNKANAQAKDARYRAAR